MEIKVNPRYKEGLEESDLTQVDDTVITIPNEAITVQEIFERSQAGFVFNRQVEAGASPDDDDLDAMDLEEFGRLDLTEQHEIIHEHKEYLKELNAAHRKAMKDADKEKNEAASSNDSDGSSLRSDTPNSKDE